MENTEIPQEHYLPVIIDHREKDVVQLWQYGKQESNVIHVERGKIAELIKALVPVSGVPSEEERDQQAMSFFLSDANMMPNGDLLSFQYGAKKFHDFLLPALAALTAENSDLMSKLELSHIDADKNFTELLELRAEVESLEAERKTVFDYDKALARENGEMKQKLQVLSEERDALSERVRLMEIELAHAQNNKDSQF